LGGWKDLFKTKTFHFEESEDMGRLKWLAQKPTRDLHLDILSLKPDCLQLNCNVNRDFRQTSKKSAVLLVKSLGYKPASLEIPMPTHVLFVIGV